MVLNASAILNITGEDVDTALFHSAKLASNRRVCWATEFDAHVAWDPTQPLFFTLEELQQGYIVIDVLISLYLFGALAIVCSNYFVPSVETFTHEFNISPSVAGAGVMAVGVSIPNIAAIMFGTFVAHNELGLGGVLGGAFWNAQVIPAILGLALAEPLELNPCSVIRDLGGFTVAGIALLIVIYDNEISAWDSVLILSLYVFYILSVVLSDHAPSIKRGCLQCCRGLEKEESQALTSNDNNEKENSFTEEGESKNPTKHDVGKTVEEEYKSPLTPPATWGSRIIWLIWLPVILVYFLLIPDYRRPKWFMVYPLTFLISLVFIALNSFVIVWLVSVIGLACMLPVTVTGITILAVGSNLPDTFNSIFSAQDGFGEMALSNAFGGSILQMLVCLGIPWLTETIMTYPEPMPLQESVLLPVSFVVASGVASLAFLWIKQWRITRCMAVIFLIMYAAVIAGSIAFQLLAPAPDV